MAKDYKHRVRGSNTLNPEDFDPVKSLSVWKWMLITAAAICAVVLVVYVSSSKVKTPDPKTTDQVSTNAQAVDPESQKPKEPEVKQPQQPQFEFYTILDKKETIVPEYEIQPRIRDENTGQAKATQYMLQAGSYNGRKDAEQMQAKLATMGFAATIQTATVENITRFRVKLGPFAQITSVNTIKARLKQNGIDVILTETGK